MGGSHLGFQDDSRIFYVTIGFLDPENLGMDFSIVSIAVVVTEIFNKTGP